MKLNVGNQSYRISFRHERLEGSDVRKAPKLEEFVGALVLSRLASTGQVDPTFDVDEAVEDLLDRYVASQVDTSHVTECYIKDSHEQIVTSGAALCDKRDQFERAMGRMIAFLKAVDSLPISQHDDFFIAFDHSGIHAPDFAKLREFSAGKSWEDIAERYMTGKTYAAVA